MKKQSTRPFLKWAGGKTQLLPELLRRIPSRFKTYHEPFIGGGALYFALRPKNACLADANSELMNVFKVVRDAVDEVIAELREHPHDKAHYYEVRAWDRAPEYAALSPVRRAARLLYLNKTCFNGLYRVNRKGHFNVPFGDYKAPKIVDAANLRACSKALQTAELRCERFIELERRVKKGDFVYFDPPYAPLSATSNFTSYSLDGFTVKDQVALRDLCARLDSRGVRFLLSNSSAPLIRELYKGFVVEEVQALRAINSVGAKRGAVTELLISNYFQK